jgi:hypothetical protein
MTIASLLVYCGKISTRWAPKWLDQCLTRLVLLLCVFLCPQVWATTAQNPEAPGGKEKYILLYQCILELEHFTRLLPVTGRLESVELLGRNFKFNGSLDGGDRDLAAKKIAQGFAGRRVQVIDAKVIPATDLKDQFELSAKAMDGLAIPEPSPPSRPKLGDSFDMSMMENAFQRAIYPRRLLTTPIGSPHSGLARVDLNATSDYPSLIDWLFNTPVLREALVGRIRFVPQKSKWNVKLVTVEATLYAGAMVLDQLNAAGIEPPAFQQSDEMLIGKTNPFAY